MSFIDTLSKLASTVSGAMSGGTIPAVISIAKDVIELVDKAKDVVAETDVPKLEALREELEASVLAHSKRTEDTLRGTSTIG